MSLEHSHYNSNVLGAFHSHHLQLLGDTVVRFVSQPLILMEISCGVGRGGVRLGYMLGNGKAM